MSLRKRTSNILIAVALLTAHLIVTPLKAFAQEEPDPRGAVLCAWMIYTSLLLIGEQCKPDDVTMLTPLRKGVADINAFILRNSEMTQTQLDAQREVWRQSYEEQPGGMCAPDGHSMKFYLDFRKRNPVKFSESIAKLLEVDRKPVGNPCL